MQRKQTEELYCINCIFENLVFNAISSNQLDVLKKICFLSCSKPQKCVFCFVTVQRSLGFSSAAAQVPVIRLTRLDSGVCVCVCVCVSSLTS